MKNPWINLPDKADFVLFKDKKIIDNFNNKANSEYAIRLNIIPEPFLGSPNAPIVLLNLNPGFNEQDIKIHRRKVFFELSWKNLRHEPTEYQFYLLDPKTSDSPGYQWWSKKLKRLINDVGARFIANSFCFPTVCRKMRRKWKDIISQIGTFIVANKILCVEYFPYHSYKFKNMDRLPSRDYSEYLVKKAIKRKALIVIMRHRVEWEKAVPKLKSYKKLIVLKNPRCAHISSRNCRKNYYKKILNELQ